MSEWTDALWYTAPGEAEIRRTSLPPLGPGMVEIETAASLISRGTERLVWQGNVPLGERDRMRAPLQEGDFPFPVKYGYAAAGTIVAGDDARLGQRVFCLAPHQRRLRVPSTMALTIPEDVPLGRAVLAANLETALNAVWDASPQPGAKVLVIGLGLVGLLVTLTLTRQRDLSVATHDVLLERRESALQISVKFLKENEIRPEFDTVFHTSASPGGLATALSACRFEGTVIELSWYGDRMIEVPLGAAFHSQRLTLKSSQVGHVAPSRRASTTLSGRLSKALALASDPRLDALVTEEIAFDDAPATLSRLLAPGAPGIATRLSY